MVPLDLNLSPKMSKQPAQWRNPLSLCHSTRVSCANSNLGEQRTRKITTWANLGYVFEERVIPNYKHVVTWGKGS